ncbi:MAG: hypothetical protein JWM78_1648 [Verrucomicrobiaceae bacterium]|nr:hypothetical protein [Verrucomicrobiaceae bacterium]
MQKLEAHGHPKDVHWADATVCWCERRGGWILPGRELTQLRVRAVEVAKRIADIHAKSKPLKAAA